MPRPPLPPPLPPPSPSSQPAADAHAAASDGQSNQVAGAAVATTGSAPALAPASGDGWQDASAQAWWEDSNQIELWEDVFAPSSEGEEKAGSEQELDGDGEQNGDNKGASGALEDAPAPGAAPFCNFADFTPSPWLLLLQTMAYFFVFDSIRAISLYNTMRDQFVNQKNNVDPIVASAFKLMDWEGPFRLYWAWGFIWLVNAIMAPQVGPAIRNFGMLPILCISIVPTFEASWGVGELQPAIWYVVWLLAFSALLMFRRGSRKVHIVLVCLCLGFISAFFVGVGLYVQVRNGVPPYLRNFICAFFLLLMKKVLVYCVGTFLSCVWIKSTDYTPIVTLASFLAGLSGTTKLLACLQTVQANAADVAMLDLCVICTSNLAIDLIERNDLVWGFAYASGLLRWRPRPIFADLCMQCSFTMPYCCLVTMVPCLPVLLFRQPWLFNLKGSSDYLVATPMFWVAFAMFLVSNAATDFVTLWLQRQPGERLRAALTRLQHSGEHTSVWARPDYAEDSPEVLIPAAYEGEEAVDTMDVRFCGVKIPGHVLLRMASFAVCADLFRYGWLAMIGRWEATTRPPLEFSKAFS